MHRAVPAAFVATLVIFTVAVACLSPAGPPNLGSSWFEQVVTSSSRIYWTQSPTGSQTEHGTIAADDPAMGRPDQRLIVGTSGGAGVAVDGQHVYWANSNDGTIGRADLGGSHVDQAFIMVGAYSFPVGVAVDSSHIYWSSTSAGTIGRADLDGSHIDQNFIVLNPSIEHTIDGLAVRGRYLYWADAAMGAIGRAYVDGTHVDTRFIVGANVPVGVAVNSDYIYWSNSGEGTIGRAELDGSRPDQQCIVPTHVPIGNVAEGVAADGRHVYWTNYPADTISRATLDGTGVQASFLPANGVPEGIGTHAPATTVSASTGSCLPSVERVVLGVEETSTRPYAVGWGTVAPPVLSNGGASASGTVSDIVWSSWGGPTAEGQGLNPEPAPEGGYYPKPVVMQFRVSTIKRCSSGGAPAYSVLMSREQVDPGGPFGPWRIDDPDLCSGYVI